MGPSEELKTLATGLVANCRADKDEKNLDMYYSDDAVSVEAFAMPGDDRIKKGLDAIRAKHEWWRANMEVQPDSPQGEAMAEGPFYSGDDRFSVIFRLKVKDKNSGDIIDMVETALYTVEGGKVVKEEFFYAM